MHLGHLDVLGGKPGFLICLLGCYLCSHKVPRLFSVEGQQIISGETGTNDPDIGFLAA